MNRCIKSMSNTRRPSSDLDLDECRCQRSVAWSFNSSQSPDVYRNILGPTTDETILAGLQTVMEMCGNTSWMCEARRFGSSSSLRATSRASLRGYGPGSSITTSDVSSWIDKEYSETIQEAQTNSSISPEIIRSKLAILEDMQDLVKSKSNVDAMISRSQSAMSYNGPSLVDRSVSAASFPRASSSRSLPSHSRSCRAIADSRRRSEAERKSSILKPSRSGSEVRSASRLLRYGSSLPSRSNITVPSSFRSGSRMSAGRFPSQMSTVSFAQQVPSRSASRISRMSRPSYASRQSFGQPSSRSLASRASSFGSRPSYLSRSSFGQQTPSSPNMPVRPSESNVSQVYYVEPFYSSIESRSPSRISAKSVSQQFPSVHYLSSSSVREPSQMAYNLSAQRSKSLTSAGDVNSQASFVQGESFNPSISRSHLMQSGILPSPSRSFRSQSATRSGILKNNSVVGYSSRSGVLNPSSYSNISQNRSLSRQNFSGTSAAYPMPSPSVAMSVNPSSYSQPPMDMDCGVECDCDETFNCETCEDSPCGLPSDMVCSPDICRDVCNCNELVNCEQLQCCLDYDQFAAMACCNATNPPLCSVNEPCGDRSNPSACVCNLSGHRNVQTVPSQVRYAIARISVFPDYTTYEIMKSTRKRPRVIPRDPEGVFVLRNKIMV